MILNDKYRLQEDTQQITLYVLNQVPEIVDGEETGVMVNKEKVLGYYSNSSTGRAQCYTRLINSEITRLEVQSLENILKIVEDTSDGILDWFERQK